MYFVPL